MEYTVVKSGTFRRWLKNLRDRRARARIVVRIERVVEGNFGDHRSVGGGIGELRIDVGGGYRIYYTIRNNAVVILLCGGGKSRQQNDIERARRMAGEL
ncbi:type II toxin-antitoxin system RelE/ParE family toxin [Candidatus Palauibacter sp.]|uniref:type II toxin-antitoxin system RelE/ParE family toxin n=1 Tax=Candidatus Palauibacter sp. TaxID=3101350 RepID=UPI003B52B43E